MKIRLHFGLIVVLIAFLGTYLETSTMPNQQIVIEFLDRDIAEDASKSTINSVKKQLERLGAALIKIDKNDVGQLVITYYSETDVEHIQKVLSNANDIKLAYESENKGATNVPQDKKNNAYKLDISEIQNSNPINWNFERTEIVELKLKSDHSHNFKENSSGQHVDENAISSKIRVAQQNNNSVSFTINEQSYKIPEVRAGPNLQG